MKPQGYAGGVVVAGRGEQIVTMAAEQEVIDDLEGWP
jgi:hypothetical protein